MFSNIKTRLWHTFLTHNVEYKPYLAISNPQHLFLTTDMHLQQFLADRTYLCLFSVHDTHFGQITTISDCFNCYQRVFTNLHHFWALLRVSKKYQLFLVINMCFQLFLSARVYFQTLPRVFETYKVYWSTLFTPSIIPIHLLRPSSCLRLHQKNMHINAPTNFNGWKLKLPPYLSLYLHQPPHPSPLPTLLSLFPIQNL